MAIDAGTQLLYSSIVWRYLFFEPSTLQLVRDRSSEIPRGDSLSIPDYNTTITLRDLAANSVANINEQQMNDAAGVLPLEKRQYWAMDIADTSIVEDIGGASIVSEGLRLAAQTIRTELDSYICTQHAANSIDGTPAAPTSTAIEILTTSATGTAHPKFDTPAYREDLVESIIDQAIIADTRGWGMNRYVVMHPEIYGQLIKYFVIDKPNFGAGQMVDSAWVQAMLTPRLGGFTPYKSIALTGDLSKAGTNQYQLHLGETGQTVQWAMQYNNTEALRGQNFIGTRIRGWFRYGARVRENARRLRITHTVSTS